MSELHAAINSLRSEIVASGQRPGDHHILFYIGSKQTKVSRDGQVNTTISGAYARTYDEDIDLDGLKGDTFENIVFRNSGGFFSDIYKPGSIGPEFYKPVFGVPSLVDAAFAGTPPVATSDPSDSEVAEVYGRLGLSPSTVENAVEGFCDGDDAQSDIIEGTGTTAAIDRLVSRFTQTRGDPEDEEIFIRKLTARPIATLPDILGRKMFGRGDGNFQGSRNVSIRRIRADEASPVTSVGDRLAWSEGLPTLGRDLINVGFLQFAFPDQGEFDTSDMEDAVSEDQYLTANTRRARVLSFLADLGTIGTD